MRAVQPWIEPRVSPLREDARRRERSFARGAALCLAACLSRPVSVEAPTTKLSVETVVPQPAIDKIDLLLAIDNSSSMADKQRILADALPDLLDGLDAFTQPRVPAREREHAATGRTRRRRRARTRSSPRASRRAEATSSATSARAALGEPRLFRAHRRRAERARVRPRVRGRRGRRVRAQRGDRLDEGPRARSVAVERRRDRSAHAPVDEAARRAPAAHRVRYGRPGPRARATTSPSVTSRPRRSPTAPTRSPSRSGARS